MEEKIHVIAYYLPQFHPTPYNDQWWGKGFTEWTNVAKAKSLYKNHYQPKIPADLGFYDLRCQDVKIKQINLAKKAGIDAFCYWHYWFSKGKRALNLPFEQVLQSQDLDFPFCLGWANHDWQKKDWSPHSSIFIKQTLFKQEYSGKNGYSEHFLDMLSAFKDKRYYKINDRLVFTVFRPDLIPDTDVFFSTWNDLAKEHGIPKFFFVACAVNKNDCDKYLSLGYDMVNLSLLNYAFNANYSKFNIVIRYLRRRLFNTIKIVDYADAIKIFDDPLNYTENIAPTLIPNWDHTPRSNIWGTVLHGSSPGLFKLHSSNILASTKNKRFKLVYLKSWNEWGEGNYMEPDLKHGHGYIDALAQALNKI